MTITENAVKKLLGLRPSNEHTLFVQLVGGGCAGKMHKMGFVKAAELAHVRLSIDGLVIGWPENDAKWFSTATLDFKDGLDGTGFTWENSAATSCCGCKKSMC